MDANARVANVPFADAVIDSRINYFTERGSPADEFGPSAGDD